MNFNTRTRQMHATLKRRACGRVVPTLEQLREHFKTQVFVYPFCPYCHCKLAAADASLDHVTPVSRGGSLELSNTHFVCKSCNKAKGDMTGDEFGDLLSALDSIGAKHRNPQFRDKVVTSLKVASSFRFGANRRAKKG